jgi:hypothetical protein
MLADSLQDWSLFSSKSLVMDAVAISTAAATSSPSRPSQISITLQTSID